MLEPSQDSGNGLRLYWSGAASVVLDDGQDSILIDPFVSRAENSPFDILFRRNAEVNVGLIAQRVKRPEIARARAIFVGHAHYDHSLDVADFAKLLQIPVYGSAGMGRILEAYGYTRFNQIEKRDDGHTLGVHGGFAVTAFVGEHGQPPIRIGPNCCDPLKETVADPFLLPAAVNDYGLGEVFAFFVKHQSGNVLHIGTAGLAEGAFNDFNEEVDVLLLSLVGRDENYVRDILTAVKPRFVIPIHYDSVFKPVSAGPQVLDLADLDGFFEQVSAEHKGVKSGAISFDVPWVVPSN